MESCKEYLEKQEDGTYSLVLRGDLCKESDILVPEGAVKFLYSKENSSNYHFANENNKLMSLEDIHCGNPYWYGNAKSYMKQCEVDVLWQREQDEPFLTPETTLNDQYAEIDEVRQVEIHGTVKAKSAWDTQVGGSHYKQFKIQPMQFALENKLDAAQQNVIKYIMRHSFKNGKQDLEKAKHYIDLMIEFYYGENNNG